MINIFIVSHGELSKGIRNSVEMITGENKRVETFSLKPGESPDKIAEAIQERINGREEEEFLILADILGGSVYNSCLRLALNKNVRIISGMNLSLVIEIFLLLPDENIDEQIELIIGRAKDGIKLMNSVKLLENEEEEEW